MATGRRQTDPAKWNKKWFRKLPAKLKLLWLYLVDHCDWAGVWEPDFEIAEFYTGETFTDSDVGAFGDKIQVIEGGKWWLTGFIDFQQPNGLNPKNKAHKSIFRSIEKNLVPYQAPCKPLASPLEGATKPPCNVMSCHVESSNVMSSNSMEGWGIAEYVVAFRSIEGFEKVSEMGIANALRSYPKEAWPVGFSKFAQHMPNEARLPNNPPAKLEGYLRIAAEEIRKTGNAGSVSAHLDKFRDVNNQIEEQAEA